MTATKANYDYGIYFRLVQDMNPEGLLRAVRAVKDIHAPGGLRDFTIAIREPTICYIQVMDNERYSQSILEGDLFQLDETDQGSLESELQAARPTHLLAFNVNNGDDPKDEKSLAFRILIEYTIDFCNTLYEGEKKIGPPYLHEKARRRIREI